MNISNIFRLHAKKPNPMKTVTSLDDTHKSIQ